MSFDVLGLAEPLLRAIRAEGYTQPTPIQTAAIPQVLAMRDVFGCAQTGTGKTAAFALPILQRLATRRAKSGAPRALVLSPTRELAIQIHRNFVSLGRHTGLRAAVVYGGVGQRPQEQDLRRGVDVLVATPGRLLDLTEQGFVRFDAVEVFVLDEADRMLDLGFLPDVKRIVGRLPKDRQTLLFSATFAADIRELAQRITRDPVRIDVAPPATTAERVVQTVHHVSAEDKKRRVIELLADPEVGRALVFARTKHRANRLTEHLSKAGVPAMAIHGNKSQTARQKALESFRRGDTPVLVATDIAARGIDVEGVTHVVNFDLPVDAESYVHRIGRTARAGASGIAVSFCEPDERDALRSIERLIGTPIEATGLDRREPARVAPVAAKPPWRGRRRSGGRDRRRAP
jgi:ATP-dependent RNA helicase RhlE